MKKTFLISLAAIFFLSSPLSGADMGNFYVGFKYWYTYWDSGAMKWFGDQLASYATDNWGEAVSVDTDTGTGFLSGPVFGYQSPTGKWNVSFAPMVFNHSSLNQSITTLGGSGHTVRGGVDMYRRDFDLALSYSLSDLGKVSRFFEYCKLYAGFKHQVVDLDIDAAEYNGGSATSNWYNMKMRYVAQMPTVGFGIAYPITSRVVLGVQGGIGMVFIDEEESYIDVSGTTTDIRPDNSVSYNGEVGLSVVPVDRMIVQAGYRYQQWKFSVKNDEDFPVKDEYEDVTQGPSLSVVYAF
jgi:opacity protein-like surface antigen